MSTTRSIAEITRILEDVTDPEVPVLTIADLGILRSVVEKDGLLEITITPTFTGCPAMRVIEEDINRVLNSKGITNFKVRTVIAPAWTTDWMTEEGKRKLREYGIAPPSMSTEEHLKSLLSGKRKPTVCPFCGSNQTHLTSAFGSTACKALHYCDACQQPFEEFKCH
ncbi:MAG: 1,2-phenylacetyl-CoA epoxidase subunit PaaD [Arcticibacter sp.]